MHFDPQTPSAPGIYAVSHPGTKSIFVAYTNDLRTRAYGWRSELKTRARPGWPDVSPDEWVFRVLQADVTREASMPLITTALQRAIDRGFTLLRMPPRTKTVLSLHERKVQLMKATVLDDNGAALTYGEIATFLGGYLRISMSQNKARRVVDKYVRRTGDEGPVNWKALLPYVVFRKRTNTDTPKQETPTDDPAYADPTLA